MSDKELNLIGYINVDGSNNNITGSINENGSSNNLVGSTINTSLEFVVLKGASAYEVAKNNGYKGTVEEWLNDLRYDHSEEFLEFANGIQNQINALAERHERYEEKFDGLNEKIDSKVIPTKVSEFENDKGYLTEHQDISDLATKKELNDGLVGKSDIGHTHEQYLTEHQNLDEYVKVDDVYGKEEVYSKDETYSKEEIYSKFEVEEIANNSGKVKTVNGVEPDDNGNVVIDIPVMPEIPSKISQLENDSNYLTEHQSLDEYAKKSEIPTLDGFVSEQWVQEQGYLTEHQDLSDYAKKSDISNVYKYIGSVEDYSSLPSENVNIGDVYNVEEDGQNYAWNGTEWDSLGSIIDFDNYLVNYYNKSEVYSKSETDNIINDKVIQADWDEVDETSLSFIKNKPIKTRFEDTDNYIVNFTGSNLTMSRNGGNTIGIIMKSTNSVLVSGETYHISIWVGDEKIEKYIVAETMYLNSFGGFDISSEKDDTHTYEITCLSSGNYYGEDNFIDGVAKDYNKFVFFIVDVSQGASGYFYLNFRTYNAVSLTGEGNSVIFDKFSISIVNEIIVKKINGKYVSNVVRYNNPVATGSFSMNRKNGYEIGQNSHAEGSSIVATGHSSHAEGNNTTASGEYGSHSEGYYTTASGDNGSHSEGYYTTASGYTSHSEGCHTTASGYTSHSEGYDTTASGHISHAEGYYTTAYGDNGSHAEGYYSRTGNQSKYGSTNSTSYGHASHAEGYGTLAKGRASHSEGNGTQALGYDSHAEGYNTTASGSYSPHAEGYYTTASGTYSHSEGYYTTASNTASHAEGYNAIASGVFGSHAEGCYTIAYGEYGSHAEGYYSKTGNTSKHGTTTSTTSGYASHAEGYGTLAKGRASHSEGNGTMASGYDSHAEGYLTTANGNNGSHSEGYLATANGENGSHAEGCDTCANGENGSHAEGHSTYANGHSSHSEGSSTYANGYSSHSEGYGTLANGKYQHVQGVYNIQNNDTLFIVGNGYYDKNNNEWVRSNAHTLDMNGNAWFSGTISVGSDSGLNKDDGIVTYPIFGDKYNFIDLYDNSSSKFSQNQQNSFGVSPISMHGYNLYDNPVDKIIVSISIPKQTMTNNNGSTTEIQECIRDFVLYRNDSNDKIYQSNGFTKIISTGNAEANEQYDFSKCEIWVADKRDDNPVIGVYFPFFGTSGYRGDVSYDYIKVRIPFIVESTLDEKYIPDTIATKEYVDDVIANISDIVLLLNEDNWIDAYENDDGGFTYEFLSDELTNRFSEIYNKLKNGAKNIYASFIGQINIPLTYNGDDNLYGNYICELDGEKFSIRWCYYNPIFNNNVSFRVDLKEYEPPSLTIGNLSYNGEESIDFSEEINRLIDEKISEINSLNTLRATTDENGMIIVNGKISGTVDVDGMVVVK